MKIGSSGNDFFCLLINRLIRKGKKTYSEKMAYNMVRNLKRNYKRNIFMILNRAALRITPVIGVKSKRVAGVSVKIPNLFNAGQDVSLAVKWFLDGVKNRVNLHRLEDRVYSELLDVINSKRVVAVKKRKELHKLAAAGRPFLKAL